MAERTSALLALVVGFAVALAGCGASDMRYYLGTFEQNQELRELFRLLERSKDEQARFVLITQIAAGLANEGRIDREILFLTTRVEKNPADLYNGYYLLLVADAYRDMKSIPLAIHYYRRILSNYADLLVNTTSIHLQCLQDLLALETNPEDKIAHYKELISRWPDQDELGANWHSMAKSYEEVGDWDQAIQAYNKYIGSAKTEIRGDPNALRTAQEKVNFYTNTEKNWMLPDLSSLVAAVKDAIISRNVSKLRRYEAKVNFFQDPWDQTQLKSDEIVNYDITSYLPSSTVFVVGEPDVAANDNEATLKTVGWNFRPSTWYLYFRRVDFPENPDINRQWEWAGIYFGEKL
jgi:tetratricopeptide (TPR) repeat protein